MSHKNLEEEEKEINKTATFTNLSSILRSMMIVSTHSHMHSHFCTIHTRGFIYKMKSGRGQIS